MPSLGAITHLRSTEKGFQEIFLNLLRSEDIPDDIKSIIESFVCQMCGRKTTNSVDQASLEIFIAK